jgi:hypothetical protein
LQSFFIKGCFFFLSIFSGIFAATRIAGVLALRIQQSGGNRTIGMNKDADVAQLVEQLTCNQLVGGSNPSIGSEKVL